MGDDGTGRTPEATVYVRGQPENWASSCQDFKAEPDPQNKDLPVLIEGSCPACRHPISRDLRSQPAVIAAALSDSTEDLYYLMTCNCVFGHPGAPDGVHGCGAQGGIKVVESNGMLNVIHHEVSPEQRDVEAWADDATRNRLAKTRAWAQQWMALLTAVAGLVSFGVVVDAAGDLGALAWGWRLLYAALGGLAIASIVTAVVRAWQAANPIKIEELKADCAARTSTYDAAVKYSETHLGKSYVWAVVGVLLFAASMVIRVMTAPPAA